MPDRGLAARPSHRTRTWHENHRDHDVWGGRIVRTPQQPPSVSLRFAAGNRRVYRLHPVELPARQHRAWRTPLGRSYGGLVLKSAGDFTALSFELPERAVQLGDAGIESLPDGFALRRQ